MTSDIIEKFYEIVKPYCDAPDSFILGGGYYLVSELLGRFFRCSQMPFGSEGGRPNFWYLMSSIPGRMRRSSVQRYVGTVLRHASMHYFQAQEMIPPEANTDEGEELDDDEKRILTHKYHQNLIDDTSIEEGSPEGIADAIQSAHDELGTKVFRITSTEFGGVLARARGKDYMSGVLTLLSKLRYGEGGTVYLSRRGGKKGVRRIPPDLYVTLFAGMQEPKYYVDIAMIRQGTGRRLLIDYVEKNPNWEAPLNQDRDLIWDELRAFGEKMGRRMVHIENKIKSERVSLIDMHFNPIVYDKINTFAKELDEALDKSASNVNVFRQSIWEHLSQVCMLRRIASIPLKITKMGLTTRSGLYLQAISPDNYEKAREFIDPFLESASFIIDSIGEVEEKVQSYRIVHDKTFRRIEATKEEGISRSDLLGKMGCTADKLDEYVADLRLQGRIVSKKIRGKGRTGTRYWTKEFAPR